MQVKTQELELDMKHKTGFISGKEYVKAVCCHPAYLIYMQIKSCKMLVWMKHKLESRFLGEISITSDVIVFGDQDPGTGVNEKKDTGNTSLK